MVSQDVYSAYAYQHKQNLMQAAYVSRFLHEGQNHSWKLNQNTPSFLTRLLKRLSSDRLRFSNPAKREVRDDEGLVVGESVQSI